MQTSPSRTCLCRPPRSAVCGLDMVSGDSVPASYRGTPIPHPRRRRVRCTRSRMDPDQRRALHRLAAAGADHADS